MQCEPSLNTAKTSVTFGTINACAFVSIDITADFAYLQSSGTSTPIAGVSQEAQEKTPGLSGSNALLCASGNPTQEVPFQCFVVGAQCQLYSGVSGYVRGDYLTAETTTGYGQTATTGQEVGAQAMTSAAPGTKGWVLVLQRKA